MQVRRLTEPLEIPPNAPTASVPLASAGEPFALPFDARIVTLRPGSSTRPHDHGESELWLVLAGRGEVVEDAAVAPIRSGEIAFMPPLGQHALRNLSDTEPLVFLTMFWQDATALENELERRARPDEETAPVLLLPSFPTPNGDLHVGHLAGPYVAADICRRALLLAGAEPALLLGTVGHQSQVAVRAEREGLSFYDMAERCTSEIIATLDAAEIHPDVFLRPAEAGAYADIAREIFRTLLERRAVVPRTRLVNWCASCSRYLFEAFVVGTCPHCGAPDASGTECELCAVHHDDAELLDPRCSTCGVGVERRPLERFYLPLEPLRPAIEAVAKRAELSPRMRAFVEVALAHELPEIAISYVSDAGVPLGVPGYEQQRLYSSFELAARFLAAVDAYAGERGWREFMRDERPRTVLFFGHDNAYLRAFIFPAVLAAFSDDIPLPEVLVANEFYRLEGTKFSTGRNHAIWGRDLVQRASADAVRLHLALTRPEDEQTNFTLADFAATVDRELIGEWEAWLHELDERLARFSDRAAPEPGPWRPEAHRLYAEVKRATELARAAYEPRSFSTRAAAGALTSLVRTARRFGRATADYGHHEATRDPARTALALELLAARALALHVAPIMPSFAATLLAALGDRRPLAEQQFEDPPGWVAPGTRVTLDRSWFDPVR